MRCEIIRDLLPSYIDGLTSGVTNEEIKKHLDECETCREYYEEMQGMNLENSNFMEKTDEKEKKDRTERILKKFRHIWVKWIAVSCTAAMAVVLGFFFISKIWIQLPYEKVQVQAEIQTDETGGVKITEKTGFHRSNYMDCRYKDVSINGENKAVVFVNCQSTVGDYVFYQEPIQAGTEGVWVQGGTIDKDFRDAELIYYLDKGIDKIENLSDAEAKDLMDKYGTLLWEK